MRIYDSSTKIGEWNGNLGTKKDDNIWFDACRGYITKYTNYLDDLTANGETNIIVDYNGD